MTQPLVFGSGSGDKMFDWVLAFGLLLIAVVGTIAWSVVARRRVRYVGFQKWFRLFLRFSLGSTLVSYGAAKAIPLQMPYPSLQRLLEPFGHFSPMGVLWYSIGASRPYEIFTGCAELLAGVLLFIPATATLGALVALACTIQIFTLNMTYNVPVKLFSFHLILMSLFLLAPDAAVCERVPVEPHGGTVDDSAARSHAARHSHRCHRAARLRAYLVGMNMNQSVEAWNDLRRRCSEVAALRHLERQRGCRLTASNARRSLPITTAGGGPSSTIPRACRSSAWTIRSAGSGTGSIWQQIPRTDQAPRSEVECHVRHPAAGGRSHGSGR